jgi:hypothetical protein
MTTLWVVSSVTILTVCFVGGSADAALLAEMEEMEPLLEREDDVIDDAELLPRDRGDDDNEDELRSKNGRVFTIISVYVAGARTVSSLISFWTESAWDGSVRYSSINPIKGSSKLSVEENFVHAHQDEFT